MPRTHAKCGGRLVPTGYSKPVGGIRSKRFVCDTCGAQMYQRIRTREAC